MPNLSRGLFIVFCGPDGGGKSTQITLLSEWLTSAGYAVLQTDELRKSKVGKQIRTVTQLDVADGMVELFLFSAARRHNNVRYVIPALDKNMIVLLDRYIMDTYAYQCTGRKALTDPEFKFIMDRAVNGVQVPDLCVWMDLHPSIGLKRKMEQGDIDRFESEDLSFHESVARGFGVFFKKWPEYAHVRIDASKGKRAIHRVLRERVSTLLSQVELHEGPA